MKFNQLLFALLLLLAIQQTVAGPFLAGGCAAMCAAMCGGTAVAVGVATAGVGAVVAGPGCYALCMSTCGISLFFPTP